MNLYARLVRPLLFQVDPELAHRLTVGVCRLAGAVPPLRASVHGLLSFVDPALCSHVAGLTLRNPIGLAAGWDKSGHALAMLGNLGFGFAEIGSISAEPSAGNPKPRLFRLPLDRAIVVNYGLPNDGAAAVAHRLQSPRRPDVPIGVNIVKTNHDSAIGDAKNSNNGAEAILADYVRSLQLVKDCADYYTLNLSCPNADGGKDYFADPRNISRLLDELSRLGISRPLFLKIAPNHDPAFLDAFVQMIAAYPIVKGFVFNLPPGKPASLRLMTARSVWERWPGAVSGQPVAPLINKCIRELYVRLPKSRYAIIGAGGVFSAADAYEKITLGASLVQVYTALIYEGPTVVKRINEGLCHLLARDGFRNVSEAVGTAAG